MLQRLGGMYATSSVDIGYRTSSGFFVEGKIDNLDRYWYELQPAFQEHLAGLLDELRESPKPPILTIKRGYHEHSLY